MRRDVRLAHVMAYRQWVQGCYCASGESDQRVTQQGSQQRGLVHLQLQTLGSNKAVLQEAQCRDGCLGGIDKGGRAQDTHKAIAGSTLLSESDAPCPCADLFNPLQRVGGEIHINKYLYNPMVIKKDTGIYGDATYESTNFLWFTIS